MFLTLEQAEMVHGGIDFENKGKYFTYTNFRSSTFYDKNGAPETPTALAPKSKTTKLDYSRARHNLKATAHYAERLSDLAISYVKKIIFFFSANDDFLKKFGLKK